MLLFPNTENSNGISRNINGENRKRLKEFLQTLKNSFSLIIRTSSNASSIEEIKEDYYNLHKTWLNISEQAKNKRRPSILLEEDLFLKKLREYSKYNIKSALIEGKNLYEKIKQYCEKKMIEFPYIELENNIFRHIENQVEQLYSSKIGLPSGGTIVIEHTEALTAIDVNSKNSLREKNIEATALKTNIEAAHEIARQIILRNIGGLIVIDFIDMFKEEDIGDINKIIKKAFKEDKAITSVIGCSTFGIMQISRQRLSPSIVEKSFTQCKACSSGLELKTESSALNLLRKIGNEYNQIDKKHHIIKIYTTDKIIQTLLNDYFKSLSKYANIKWELVCDYHPMYNKIEVVK